MMISSDFLENINEEDNEGTYRIGLPQPHPVENESEFMTNSGRSLKKTQVNVHHNHEPYRDSLNEDDYSSQKTRVIPHRGDGSSKKQFEMTKSIQAQLHLSLDRLSEASYDQSNVKKQKLNTPKTIPTVKKSLSPTHAQTNGLHVTESRQSSQADSDASKNANRQQSSATSGKLSTVKDSLSLSHKAPGAVRFSADFNEDDDSDNDDIRTVVVDDSLDDESQLDQDSASPQRKTRDSHQPDPYAHLRYDPEWRNDMDNGKKPTTTVGRQEIEPPMVIDFRSAPRIPATPDLESGEAVYAPEHKEQAQPSGGAITIHNNELSPARSDAADEDNRTNNSTSTQHTDGDSLVRHSTDSAQLENMNTLYEQEFRRMLELERHWNKQGVEPFSEDLPPQFRPKGHLEPPSPVGPGVPGGASSGSPRNHNPPAPYPNVRKAEKSSPDAQQTATRQTNHNQSPMAPPSGYASDSALAPKHRRTIHMRAHAPTPPKAPKSNRDKDYIEMNKIRLGRKSNSASYLEMHSKLKKQQVAEERAANEKQKQQTRPKTDDIVAKSQHQENPAEIFERIQRRVSDENLGEVEVEDAWIQQAQRLKEIKEAKVKRGGKSKSVQQRRTLREVGNTSEDARRPPFDPEDALLDKRRSPRRISPPRHARDSLDHPLAADENDFSAHPAFAPRQQHDPRRSADHFVSPQQHQQQQLRQHARIAQLATGQSNPHYNYQGSEESPYSDADPYDASWGSGYAEQKYYYAEAAGRPYYQQQQQQRGRQGYDEPAAKASPLMQAYRRRYERSPPSEERIMALPPKPENPLSPRNIAEGFHYGDGASPRLRSSSDPSMAKRSNSYLKKRVNFDPVLYGPPSPQSRIPLPVGQQNNIYRYPVPLPPTNGALPPGAFVQTRYEQSSQETQYIWSTTHPGEVAPARVPLLPPIVGTSSDTSGHHVTHQQHVPSPRISEDDRGSYLQQHVKQMQKPGYKKYTLEDYKNLKRDLNLGGLGPDLISAKQKMGKVERARKYAEFIRQQHKSSAAVASLKAGQDDDVIVEQQQRFVVGADSEEQRRERNEKRKRAIEYARQVPKPKAQQQVRHEEQQSARPDPRDQDEGFDLDMLRTLQERHEREKALVAGISTTNMT